MPFQNAYPVLFALAGFVAASLLSERALAHMDADAKAALIDSLAGTRLLGLLVAGVFVLLVLWRPSWGWIFLGFTYLGLGIRSRLRLKRLNLPPRAARLIFIGNVSAVLGINLCALIFALKALR